MIIETPNLIDTNEDNIPKWKTCHFMINGKCCWGYRTDIDCKVNRYEGNDIVQESVPVYAIQKFAVMDWGL